MIILLSFEVSINSSGGVWGGGGGGGGGWGANSLG